MSFEDSTRSGIDVLRWHGLSRNVVAAVAKDFIDGSVDLEEAPVVLGVQYQIKDDEVSVRFVDDSDNRSLTTGLSTADFIGGVAFALAREGVIDVMSATPTNVSRVCFAVGQLTAQMTKSGEI